MEKYRYYGSGRYFAVTNKYPRTSGVYDLPFDTAHYPGKWGEIAGKEFGDGHREGFDPETSANLSPEREPYSLGSNVDDGALFIREDAARWRYDDPVKESYNSWDQRRDDGIDMNSQREPHTIQNRFTEEPIRGEKYEEQPATDNTLIDDIASKEDYTENDRNYQLPDPVFYHDQDDVAMGNNGAVKPEDEGIMGSNRVNGKSELRKTDEFGQQEEYKATDYGGENVENQKKEEDWRKDRDKYNKHSDFPRADRTEYGRAYQGKEPERPKEERPYYAINKYDSRPLKKDAPFVNNRRYEGEGKKGGIDKKILYYESHDSESPDRLEKERYIGKHKKPYEGRQIDPRAHMKERNDEKGPPVMDENKNIGGYGDVMKDRSFVPKFAAYERYNDDKKASTEESKFLKDNKEPKREENAPQKFPEYMSYQYPEENKERMNGMNENSKDKYPVYGKYEEKPIQCIESTKDFAEPQISPEEENFAEETPAYPKYNDEQQYDFEIDLDEICENEKKADVEIQIEDVVTEELIQEEFHEIQKETLALEVLDDDDDDDDEAYEENEENDWPSPPEDNGQEEREFKPGYDRREEYFPEQRNNNIEEDASLYTSFLTIDVTPGKRESLDGTILADSKHRSSLLNLVTGTHELEHSEDSFQLDKEDMDKIRHDIEMISKYLHNMPLGASHWPQNYDVLRDLVKLYLASKNTSSAALNYLLDYFLKLDWPGLFLKCSRKIMKSYPQVFVHSSDRKIPFEDPTPETLDMTKVSLEYAVAVIFQVILSLAAEFTEIHQQSKNDGYKGFIKFIFQELLPKLHGIPWGQSTAREEFLHSSIDILYNYSQSTPNIASFYECNATDVLINLRRETDFIGGNRVNIGALLTLSFLIDDRNNHIIFTDSAPISLLIHYIEESLSKIDHCYADFCLSELIDGLTRIASHDQNKLIICSHGGINAITRVLRKSSDEQELSAVCRLIWSLCFVEKCKQKIITRSPEIIEIIRSLQNSKNTTLQQLAESLIWEFEEKYSDISQSAKSDVQHIFISYHAENREQILNISDRLKDKGYKVWLEKSKGESYPKHLTEAVENAAVVLVAISRKYKQSPSVFAEADYAFKLCKPMIPLTLERNYKPDGWLGMLVGSKVWLDLTQESKFEGNMQMLMRQIGEKGKAERAVNILYIDEKQGIQEKDGGKSEMRLIDISRWGNEEVMEWLQQNNLKSCVPNEKLKKLRGPHLLQLHHLRRESPDFYYNSLEPQLGFTNVIHMMEFTQALESLTELQ